MTHGGPRRDSRAVGADGGGYGMRREGVMAVAERGRSLIWGEDVKRMRWKVREIGGRLSTNEINCSATNEEIPLYNLFLNAHVWCKES